MTCPPVNCWRGSPMIKSGTTPMMLPPYGYAMDPSDPATWRRPVRFT